MSYLSRYQAGECQAVWDELRRLDLGVHQALDDEAKAVAELLIVRARSNLDRIGHSLTEIGYEFDGAAANDAGFNLSELSNNAQSVAADMLARIDGLGSALPNSGLLRAMAENLQHVASRATGPLPKFPDPGPKTAEEICRPLGDNGRSIACVEEFERECHKLPLALAAFWRSVGHADFLGNFRGRSTSDWLPLLVLPCMNLTDDYQAYVDDNGDDGGFAVELAANPKDDDHPLEVDLTPGVDAKLMDGEWFVDYLRRGIRSAGFLSISQADMPAEIAAIAKAWEPF